MNVRLAGDIQGRYRFVQNEQHDDPRSRREPTVVDPTEIAQSHSEDVEGRGPHVLEEKSPQIVEITILDF